MSDSAVSLLSWAILRDWNSSRPWLSRLASASLIVVSSRWIDSYVLGSNFPCVYNQCSPEDRECLDTGLAELELCPALGLATLVSWSESENSSSEVTESASDSLPLLGMKRLEHMLLGSLVGSDDDISEFGSSFDTSSTFSFEMFNPACRSQDVANAMANAIKMRTISFIVDDRGSFDRVVSVHERFFDWAEELPSACEYFGESGLASAGHSPADP